MIFWLWASVALAALVLYLRQVYSRFSRHGVKHFTPLPFIGNFGPMLFQIRHFAEDLNRINKAFPNERFVGRYDFLAPMVVLRDLELVKKVTIKDFEYFLDHRLSISIGKNSDTFLGRNLFALKGDDWKDMRSTLSPAFTSAKIRVMVPFMMEVGDQMINMLKDTIKSSGSDYADIDDKDLTTRYAMDVIASCVFGLKVDSHTDKQNKFYLQGKKAATFGFRELLLFFGSISFPKLMSLMKVSLLTEESKHFYRSIVHNTMRDREARQIIRLDMIHLLMEARKGQLSHDQNTTADADAGFATVEESAVGRKTVNRDWSDDDLVAQAVIFFAAGFETISSSISFLLHELALNPDVQEKLVQEIRENDARNGGKFDYNSIQQMKYMDMVVSELLRKWPQGVGMDRICIKDYNLGKPNDKATEDFIIRKGEGVIISVWSIHRNPEFFPDPEKFDPERFSEENKHKINPLAYMPFGLGPRNCIGSRFALCSIKVMVYQLLQSMELSPAAKTPIRAELAPDTFNTKMKGGHWIRIRVRN